MKEFMTYLRDYANLLREASVWHNSKDILAPVINEQNIAVATDCYIYEFYCYISIITDLQVTYNIEFKKGFGDFEYKFPQAAADKAGKPYFIAIKDGVPKFQICAGTKIDGIFDSEENHPDISFQKADANDTPTEDDLIIIMDAKFKENEKAKLPKDEVYKFITIVGLFSLPKANSEKIEFFKYVGLDGNCLITNANAYSNPNDIRMLQKFVIKEVQHFSPQKSFSVLG